jgi:hypothetical protein
MWGGLWVNSATELSTAATDAVLALESLGVVVWLERHAVRRPRRVRIWQWAFGLCALAAALGAVVHGLALPAFWGDLLWPLLTFSMGAGIAMLLAGAVGDWHDFDAARRVTAWGVAAAGGVVLATHLLAGAFLVFAWYAVAVLAVAMAIYLRLAWQSRCPGAAVMAAALGVNLAALAVQASTITVNVGVTLDHNGVFHIVQMLAIALLAAGLAPGMQSKIPRAPTRARG